MNVKHALDLDMQLPSAMQTMYVKQEDSLTRTAVLTLYNGGSAFDVSDAEILQIAFFKPDQTDGLYDTMPDGSIACTVAGNVVTAQLHPQMFTAAGRVICELRMLTNDGMRLSTFSWIIFVEAAVTNGIKSESYYRFASLDGLRAELTAMIQAGHPLARGVSEDGVSYVATGDELPAVAASVGVGIKQIIFIPYAENATETPTLTLNDGEAFGIRMRAPYNQGANAKYPEAALPVPVGTLMYGVPYVLTFSGSYWFIDSNICQTKSTGQVLVAGSSTDEGETYFATVKDFALSHGAQITFTPNMPNATTKPMLTINNGLQCKICVRAPYNSVGDVPKTAVLEVPVGYLQTSTPYTMTFCGPDYWLIDSHVESRLNCAEDELQAELMREVAARAMKLYEADTIAVPIINSTDENESNVGTAYIERSSAEKNSPDPDGKVSVPTVGKVDDMIAVGYKDVTEDFKQQKDFTDEFKYLRSLGEGKWQVKTSTELYRTQIADGGAGTMYRVETVLTDDGFPLVQCYIGDDCVFEYAHDNDNPLEVNGNRLLDEKVIPIPEATNAGQFLRVSEAGKAQWVSLTNVAEEGA